MELGRSPSATQGATPIGRDLAASLRDLVADGNFDSHSLLIHVFEEKKLIELQHVTESEIVSYMAKGML